MNNVQFSDFNLPAIFVAWIVHIIMGLIWFHKRLFGNEWSRLTGEELTPDIKWVIPGFIGHLAMIFILAFFIRISDSENGFQGVTIGLLAWIGFIVPMEIGELVWEKIPFRLFLLRTGNQLLGLIVSGFILGAWQ